MSAKEKQRAKIAAAMAQRLRPGERIVQLFDAVKGGDPTMVLVVVIIIPVVAGSQAYSYNVLAAAVIGGIGGFLGAMIAALVVPRYWFILTDQRLIVRKAKSVPFRSTGTAVDAEPSSVRLVTMKRSNTSARFRLEGRVDTPLEFTVGKIWFPEVDQIAAALGSTPAPPPSPT